MKLPMLLLDAAFVFASVIVAAGLAARLLNRCGAREFECGRCGCRGDCLAGCWRYSRTLCSRCVDASQDELQARLAEIFESDADAA